MAGFNKIQAFVFSEKNKWNYPDFIFQININAGESITLPLINNILYLYNFRVEWGDGSSNSVKSFNDPDKTHQYDSSGIYTITIKGQIDAFSTSQSSLLSEKIIDVIQFGMPFKLISFQYCINLTSISATDSLNTLNLSSLKDLFKNCSNLINVNKIDEWNINNITNLESVFQDCLKFNGDISTWNLSNCNTFEKGLKGCLKFNQDLSNWRPKISMNIIRAFESCEDWTAANSNINDWALKPTSMSVTFFRCRKFNSDFDLWDLSICTSLQNTFSGCNLFNGDITNWDVSSCINFVQTFFNASPDIFNRDITGWDVSAGVNFESMFASCDLFNQPIGVWDIGDKIITSIITECKAFNQSVNNWGANLNTNTNIKNFFKNCEQFNQPLNLWNTTGQTNMEETFRSAYNFNQDISMWDYSAVSNMGIFAPSTSITPTNYDALLINLAANGLDNVVLNVGAIKHTAAGVSARNTLISKGWTITDGGLL